MYKFIIIIFILLFIFAANKNFEHFQNSINSTFFITQNFVSQYDLDNYIVKNINDEIIFKTKGEWTLDKNQLTIVGKNYNIPVIHKNNTYTFNTNDYNVTYNYPKKLIIVNNYHMELFFNNNNFELKNGTIIATVSLTKKYSNQNIYQLKIKNDSDIKYKDIFIIIFIIYKQIDKELNFSFDKLYF